MKRLSLRSFVDFCVRSDHSGESVFTEKTSDCDWSNCRKSANMFSSSESNNILFRLIAAGLIAVGLSLSTFTAVLGVAHSKIIGSMSTGRDSSDLPAKNV